MKTAICDIPKCKGEAHNEVDCCVGWTERTGSTIYKSFERPTIRKHDLCDKHYEMWCKATYGAFFRMPKDSAE